MSHEGLQRVNVSAYQKIYYADFLILVVDFWKTNILMKIQNSQIKGVPENALC